MPPDAIQSDTDASLADRLRARIDPPRTLSFTRTGGYFVLITLGVGTAAINTGNNLLFLLLGMMLSVIVASGLLSEAALRRLGVHRTLPTRLFAERPAVGHLGIENPKAWPSLSVELREADIECSVGPLAGRSVADGRTPWWKFWRRNDGEPPEAEIASAYFLRVESASSERRETPYEFPARGVYELQQLRLVTRFPFHLFEKARDVSSGATVVVYPTPRPPSDWIADLRAGTGEVPADEAGRGDEYYGLHEYRPGEDRRLIHWKRSAARGELIVKEHEAETSRTLRLHLCNVRGDNSSERAREAFEEGLEQLTGLVQTLTRRGWTVGLRTLDRNVPARPSTETDHLYQTLARTRLHEQLPEEEFAPDAADGSADVLIAFPDVARKLGGEWDRVLPLDPAPETG